MPQIRARETMCSESVPRFFENNARWVGFTAYLKTMHVNA